MQRVISYCVESKTVQQVNIDYANCNIHNLYGDQAMRSKFLHGKSLTFHVVHVHYSIC